MAASFRRVAILGTEGVDWRLVCAGASQVCPDSFVVGWDKGHVLRQALERGAICEGAEEFPLAIAGGEQFM